LVGIMHHRHQHSRRFDLSQVTGLSQNDHSDRSLDRFVAPFTIVPDKDRTVFEHIALRQRHSVQTIAPDHSRSPSSITIPSGTSGKMGLGGKYGPVAFRTFTGRAGP